MTPVTRKSRSIAHWPGAVRGAAAAGLLLAVVHPAFGQAKTPKAPKLPVSLVIYRGDSLQTGLSLASWGSGTADKDTGKVFSGTESLKITTHGMYQGASLMFSKPINLAPFLANKNDYLTVAVLPPTTTQVGGSEGGFAGFSGGKGAYGGPPGLGGGSPGGPGLQGGNPGAFGSLGGYGGKGQGGQVQTQKNRTLENLRMVLVTTGGKNIEVMLPLANASDDNQWKVLSIPLAVIPNLTSGDAEIQEMRFFGDAPATLNIGSIGVNEDAAQITLSTINDKTVQRLAKYQYVATATAGITPLVYTWDWDASDGIQEETIGRNVTHIFRKASVDETDVRKSKDFVVTVTVSDLYHLKAPAKTTFKVHVTP